MSKPKQTDLQKLWYQKLKDSGFKDIESTDLPDEPLKVWDSRYFLLRNTPKQFAARAEYYHLARQMLHWYPFESELERNIWSLHAEAKSLRAIGQELSISKDTARLVIKKLRANISMRF